MSRGRELRAFTGRGYDKGRGKVWQVAWFATMNLVFVKWWLPARFRPAILRAFGAQVGARVLIRHRVRVQWPWKLSIGDDCWVGEGVWLLNLEQITVEHDVCLSQEAFVCTGSHRHDDPAFEFDNAPITIGAGAWVAARATVLRGTTVPPGALVAGGSVAGRRTFSGEAPLMRILHVVTLVDDDSSYGGPLTVALNQCRELRARGHDAQLLAGWRGHGSPPTELDGVPAHLFAVRKVLPGVRFSGLFSLRLAGWLQRHAADFDVAHLHLARDLVPLLSGLQLRRAGVPYLTQTHGMVMPDGRQIARVIDVGLTRRILERASARFVLTERERGGLAALLGPLELTSLRNGVTAPATRAARPERDLLDVLFMARLHPRKRVLDFAEVAFQLIREGAPARFSVVGPDEGDLPALRGLLTERLTYEGPTNHEHALQRLGQADLYVLPSVDEPFPMTLLEALSVGTPAICTTGCGSGAELGEAGAVMVVEPGAGPLADAVRKLVGDAGLREQLALAGVDAVQGRFSMREVGELLTAYYRRAVTLRTPGRPRLRDVA